MYQSLPFLGLFIPFIFELSIDMFGFKYIIMLFVFYLSYLFFIPRSTLPSFELIECIFLLHFIFFVGLVAVNCILLFWQFLTVYSVHLKLIIIYPQAVLYHITFHMRSFKQYTSNFPLLAFVLLLSYILFLYML